MLGSRGTATPPARRRAAARGAAVTLPPLLLTGCTGADADAAAAFGALAVLAALAAGAAAGAWIAAQRQRHALHDARQQARLVAELLPGAWRSDASHRLRYGSAGPAGAALTDLFECPGDDAGLAGRLSAARAIDALPVRRRADGSAWELRARPSFDAGGAFDGHVGSLREVAPDAASAAALAALGAAAGGALLVLVQPLGQPAGAGTDWTVLAANDAARARFGDAPMLPAARIADALPTPLQRAWADGSAAAESDGWRLRRVAGPPGVALLWQAGGDGGVDAGEQASLAYSVSHDLRAPIRVVEGFTRIVKEDYGSALDRVANDHLDRVLGAAARMNQMIDAMLTLARLSTQPLARQPVDLSQLAGFVVDELRRAAPERRVEVDVDPGLRANGDPTLLRLVLENLLGNAWKYTGQRPQARIVLARERHDGRPVFVVRDNGAGFDMRSAERLFGLFQRLHSASDFPGTGVGLASVRRIVQRHGGQIWADGEPGRGAAFYFTLRD